MLSRVLEDLALASVPLARERHEVLVSRLEARESHEVSVAERTRLLGRVQLFDGLEEGERRQLAADLRRVVVANGKVVFRQDDPGETLYVVAEGAVDVLVSQGDDQDPTRLATLGAGDFFGEMSLLTGDLRRATVRAATDCVLYELSRETVAGIVATRPDVADILSLTLARRKAALDSAGRTQADAGAVERGRQTILQKMLGILAPRAEGRRALAAR